MASMDVWYFMGKSTLACRLLRSIADFPKEDITRPEENVGFYAFVVFMGSVALYVWIR